MKLGNDGELYDPVTDRSDDYCTLAYDLSNWLDPSRRWAVPAAAKVRASGRCGPTANPSAALTHAGMAARASTTASPAKLWWGEFSHVPA